MRCSPWVNNCVGLVNHKFFLLFLLYVFLISCYALVLIFRRHYFICGGVAGHSLDDDDDERRAYGHTREHGSAGGPDGFGPNESRHLYHSHHKQHLRHRHHSHSRHLFFAGGAEEHNDAASGMAVEPYPGRCDISAGSFMMTLLLFIEAILFGLFTSCMMCDQSSVVTTNLTKIDRLKKRKAEESEKDSGGATGGDGGGGKGGGKGARKGLAGEGAEGGGKGGNDDGDDGHAALESTVVVNEIFGGEGGRGFRVHWLLPVLPSLPNSVRDEVFGFTRADAPTPTQAATGIGGGHGGSSSGMSSGMSSDSSSSSSSSTAEEMPAATTSNPPQHLSRDFNIRNVNI